MSNSVAAMTACGTVRSFASAWLLTAAVWCSPVQAEVPPAGSLTWTFSGRAGDDAEVRVTAIMGDVPLRWIFDETIRIGGLTNEQVANIVLSRFDVPWGARSNGPNSIILQPPNTKLKSIDGGSKGVNLSPKFDGTVGASIVLPGQKWKLAFSSETFFPGQGVTEEGMLALSIPGVGTYSTMLGVGATPTNAAQSFYSMLVNAGFQDVDLGTDDSVGFYRAPNGSPIGRIDEVGFTGSNLHTTLVFPEVIPAPAGSVALLLLAGVTACRRRREASVLHIGAFNL